MQTIICFVLCGLVMGGCAVPTGLLLGSGQEIRQPERPELSIVLEHEDEEPELVATIRRDAKSGAEFIEVFFGHAFGDPVEIRVMPSRAAFDEYAGANWGFPETQCWMVGGAETQGLVLLSPGSWDTDACEHDPDDTEEIRKLIAHELVHTYHMRVNPSNEFEGVTTIDWFVEGLAVYVSGQLDEERKASAAEALERGEGPDTLADAWKGSDKYGISGSMVSLIDKRWGQSTLVRLLCVSSQDELLEALKVSEQEFLTMWRDAAPW